MEIRAFRGWRYAAGAEGDIGPLIAPPYDILSGQDKQRLLAACRNNIVAVDMPHVPPKEEGPQQEYVAAAGQLEAWKAAGVLRRDERPAIYVYQQTYSWAGRQHVRRRVARRQLSLVFEPGKMDRHAFARRFFAQFFF